MINYYNKQLNEKNLSDPLGKNLYGTGTGQVTNASGTSSGAASFRPYGNLLSTNNHFINSNLSPTPNGAFLHSNGAYAKATGSTSPSALTALDLDLSANPRLPGAPLQTAAFPTVVKNPLLSSSNSSLQHQQQQQQQIDQSKENLEM